LKQQPTAMSCTLSLHDALPIFDVVQQRALEHLLADLLEEAAADGDADGALGDELVEVVRHVVGAGKLDVGPDGDLLAQPVEDHQDRKSTRLNSSHLGISYAVFC